MVARIVRAVAEALSAPGPELARERAGIVAALAAYAAGAFGGRARRSGEGAPPW